MRESGKLSDEWLCNDLGVDLITLCMACSLDISLPEPGARSHVVDVLLDVGWHVIRFGRDIMSSRSVFPYVEFSDEQAFDFSRGCVELNPLNPNIRARNPEESIRILERELPACWQRVQSDQS